MTRVSRKEVLNYANTNESLAMYYSSWVNFLQINVEGFQIKEIKGPALLNVSQSKSSDNNSPVRFTVHGVDIDLRLFGSVSYLWRRSITFEHLRVRNFTLQFSMSPNWEFLSVSSCIQDFDLVV